MGAGGLDLSLEAKALPDDVRKLAQNLTQVAACLLLQQDRGNEETHIDERYQSDQFAERYLERGTELQFVRNPSESGTQRIGRVGAEHFERNGEAVSAPHRARKKIERFGKLFFKGAVILRALAQNQEQPQREAKGCQ